jgi:hypothetical protein
MDSDTEHATEVHLRTAQLVAAERPIAIRSGHVAKSEILMRVVERANHIAPSDFIAFLGDGTKIITAHGRGALFKKKREIRDSSGVIIFELFASSSKMRGMWHIEHPGRSREHLLEVDLHGPLSGKVSLAVHFANRCAHDGPLVRSKAQGNPSPAAVIFEVKGRDVERIAFDVFYLGAQVASIRRLVPKHISSTGSKGRPVWEARVSANVDVTIVSFGSCYIWQNIILTPLDRRKHCSSCRRSFTATLYCGGCSSCRRIYWNVR